MLLTLDYHVLSDYLRSAKLHSLVHRVPLTTLCFRLSARGPYFLLDCCAFSMVVQIVDVLSVEFHMIVGRCHFTLA